MQARRLVMVSIIIGCAIIIIATIIDSEMREHSAPPIPAQLSINTYFCPLDDCVTPIIAAITAANTTLDCAVYEIDHPDIIQAIRAQQERIAVRIVTDDRYVDESTALSPQPDTSGGQMHNKFCIVDNITIITGSANFAVSDLTKSRNNVLIIQSSTVADMFNTEFGELWQKEFRSGNRSKQNTVHNNETSLTQLFCPEDGCEEHLVTLIDSANISVDFMTFSFTSKEIATHILAAQERGVRIHGLFDYRQSRTGIMPLLAYNGAGVQVANVSMLHHKVFIIDGTIVQTGSYNPTTNGDERNDDNAIIICDKTIAQAFLDEMDTTPVK